MLRLKAIHLMLSLASLSVPALIAQNAVPALPGTLNYIEGQASLEGRQLSPRSVGHTELAAGQYLATGNGKVEVLLTPGVFLRLDKDSTLKMVMPDLTHTEVQLTQGRASVEVDQLYKQNDIFIDLQNGQTQLLKSGLYEFEATGNTVRVFKGEAAAFSSVAPQPNERSVKVKEGKRLSFTGAGAKPTGFDRGSTEASDPLYQWSSLRSSYLGEANLSLASSYANDPYYSDRYASGWLWSPSLYSYTWLPGNGLFFSPFGYGFYSPYYLYGGGFIYGGYRGSYGYRGLASRSSIVSRGTYSNGYRASSVAGGGLRGGSSMGGMRGGGGGGHR